MNVLERVVGGLIRQKVEIGELQCGFMSGRGTTDAIFILRQLQQKHLAANKPLYMNFVVLEKAFDRVPRDVIIVLEALSRELLYADDLMISAESMEELLVKVNFETWKTEMEK